MLLRVRDHAELLRDELVHLVGHGVSKVGAHGLRVEVNVLLPGSVVKVDALAARNVDRGAGNNPRRAPRVQRVRIRRLGNLQVIGIGRKKKKIS